MTLRADFLRRFDRGPRIEARLELPLEGFGITVLFGPSGCGKTTVLRALAGLDRPESGTIQAGGATWFDGASGQFLPPWRRQVGCVFQEAALFPHLSVAENLGFGLGPWPRRERTRLIEELAGRVGLQDLLHRRPSQLSGGQKQRVALARALAPRPRLLLLDEPFAALDRPAAESLRHELRGLLKALDTPAILVTHDRGDALALGDRILVMEGGRIVQQALPSEVFTLAGTGDPADPLGNTCILPARLVGRVAGLLRFAVGQGELFAPDPGGAFRDAHLCIRTEGVSLERSAPGAMTQRNRLPARILEILPAGAVTRVKLDCGFPLEALVTSWACQDLGLEPGQTLHALVKATAIAVVPAEE